MDCPQLTTIDIARILAIADSYRRLTGRPLVTEGADLPALWSAPLAIVAHDTRPDPVFYFGNRLALRLFEMDFASFTRLPSRCSAEPLLQDQRADLMKRVARDGIVENYAGVRISSTGRRFRIADVAIWNVTDDDGAFVGQAAAFSNWAYIEP